eukprot:2709058-Rhodomonas_salina.1
MQLADFIIPAALLSCLSCRPCAPCRAGTARETLGQKRTWPSGCVGAQRTCATWISGNAPPSPKSSKFLGKSTASQHHDRLKSTPSSIEQHCRAGSHSAESNMQPPAMCFPETEGEETSEKDRMVGVGSGPFMYTHEHEKDVNG